MLTNKTFYGLLGSIVLAAGLPASASDGEEKKAPDAAQQTEAAKKDENAKETVRIVVSLPNGRKYVIVQEAPKSSDEGGPLGTKVSRVLPDGSRISYGTGMSSPRSSARSRGSAGTRRAGGGAVRSAGGSSLTGSGSGGGGSAIARLGGGGGGGGGSAASGGGGGGGGSAAGLTGSNAGGGFRAPHQRHSGSESPDADSGGSGGIIPGRSAQPTPRESSGSNGGTKQPVPTIGSPRYDDDGATGGQNVTFHDAGMSAMLVGRTVYVWGADIVQATEEFRLIEGERVAFDGAVVRNHRPIGDGQPLSSADQLFAPLKLEFRQGDTVTLTMHSQAVNQDNPARDIRNWTFRVR